MNGPLQFFIMTNLTIIINSSTLLKSFIEVWPISFQLPYRKLRDQKINRTMAFQAHLVYNLKSSWCPTAETYLCLWGKEGTKLALHLNRLKHQEKKYKIQTAALSRPTSRRSVSWPGARRVMYILFNGGGFAMPKRLFDVFFYFWRPAFTKITGLNVSCWLVLFGEYSRGKL